MLITNPMILTSFYPIQLPNTVNWLDGPDPSGNGILPANNTALSGWLDKSNFKYNFSQGTGANQALFKTNVVGSKGAILFDGTNDYFSRAYTANLFTNNTTIAIVCSTAVLDTNFRSPTTTRISSSTLFGHAIYRYPSDAGTGPNDYGALVGNGAGSWSPDLIGPLAVVNTPTLIILNSSGGTMSMYVNGTFYSSGAYSTNAAPIHFLGSGGSASTPSLYWSGYIYERVIRSVASTSDELNILTNYLKTRWGIA
jgi:hypothetical protein